MTTVRISEQVRRLEDTIESLRRDNKELRDKLKNQEPQQKEFMITYKWQVTELPTEWNKEWDMYTISYKDRMTGKIITDKDVEIKDWERYWQAVFQGTDWLTLELDSFDVFEEKYPTERGSWWFWSTGK